MRAPTVTIPAPHTLLPYDVAARQMNMKILVIGGGAEEYLRLLGRALGGRQTDSTHERPWHVPGMRRYAYLCMGRPGRGGWQMAVHLYAFGTDPGLHEPTRRFARTMEGLIAVESGGDLLEQSVFRVFSMILPARLPAILIGGPAFTGRPGITRPCWDVVETFEPATMEVVEPVDHLCRALVLRRAAELPRAEEAQRRRMLS